MKAETAWLVFVVAAVAAALALGCGNVTARAELEDGGAGGQVAAVDAGAGGGAGARQVDAQAAADVGRHVGASTAPACLGTFVARQPCGEIGTSYQCEVGCSSSPAENAAGCLFYGVTYCVSSCAACQL